MLHYLGAVIDNKYINPLNAKKENKYKCPDCNDNIILKAGKIRSPHFSHRQKCLHTISDQLIHAKNKVELLGNKFKINASL
jgi:competence CoiA-like predicted nuclease